MDVQNFIKSDDDILINIKKIKLIFNPDSCFYVCTKFINCDLQSSAKICSKNTKSYKTIKKLYDEL